MQKNTNEQIQNKTGHSLKFGNDMDLTTRSGYFVSGV